MARHIPSRCPLPMIPSLPRLPPTGGTNPTRPNRIPMASLRSRVESWIRDQTVRVGAAWPSQPPRWRWPPWKGREGRKEQERRIREEYERQRRQLNDLCATVKVESVADLQDVLISMVLSECVYKRPAMEMVRYINKFKSDFGGQIVSLERVQPSLDHVPHRYLLAEAGDTLFASFIGTKQYKDVIADANIFQGAIFHEDNEEDLEMITAIENNQEENQKKSKDTLGRPLQTKPQLKKNARPAAHRGFLARAKGIPALELYRLALKKKRKLVLCGHSLGGAVAALATLAILRVLASTSTSKEHDKIQVKCITFSQPPVGNSALKDYVYQKGWEHHFKSYCIPEDLVPRILSPAYFHHYNAQTPQASPNSGTSRPIIKPEESKKASRSKSKGNDGEQLVLGVGPIQTSFWRLSKLVPLEGVRKQLSIFRRVGNEVREASSFAEQGIPLTVNEDEAEPQSLEIQEGSDGISLTPLLEKHREPIEGNDSQLNGKNSVRVGDSGQWRRVPYLPSYVPFGQLYLLGNSSVESLSDAEYSKLISVRSVIAELRERFQSHSMKSYRSRFQKIYDQCMCMNASPFMGLEQLAQFPHLQKWLGLAAVGSVELGHIVDPPVIRTATSIIPLGWSGVPGDRSAEPLKVDIVGHGLHLCTLVQARINGNWCSTAVESLPSTPPCPSEHNLQPDLQKMRILVGSPLKRPPKHPVLEDSLLPTYSSPVTGCGNSSLEYNIESFSDEKSECSEDLNGFIIYCTSDFITVMKKVYVRTRRVRLLGFEGSGKTSLFKAILDRGKRRNKVNLDSILPDVDCKEAVVGGICYLDSAGVNLQELHSEASHFRKELQMGVHDLSKKTDLVVLVHNLSQKIPRYHQSNTPQPIPALSLLLNEATALGIPWVFAITNKFSVSADQQRMLVKYAMESYQASPSATEVINSCPFIMPVAVRSSPSLSSADDMSSKKEPAHRIISAPLNFARMPFQKRPMIFPVEGVTAFHHLVHRVLQSHEEMAFQELASERLSVEIAREQEMALDARREPQGKGGSITAAAVGASLGAGLGLVMAVVMGAASALRKP